MLPPSSVSCSDLKPYRLMVILCLALTDAIDKGDNRRLGKKPVFTSSQVI